MNKTVQDYMATVSFKSWSCSRISLSSKEKCYAKTTIADHMARVLFEPEPCSRILVPSMVGQQVVKMMVDYMRIVPF